MESLPPELVAPEDREERAVEVERQISREWMRFANVNGILTLAAVAVALAYAWAGTILFDVFAVVLILLGVHDGRARRYWIAGRIRPLQNEIAALRAER